MAASTRFWTRRRRQSDWRPIAPMSCARPSCAAARGARSRSRASISDIQDKIPFGAAMNKASYLQDGPNSRPALHQAVLEKIQSGEIDPSFVITHKSPLEQGPRPTRRSATRKMAASRWSSNLDRYLATMLYPCI